MGKRASIGGNTGSNNWTRYSYSASSIEKRTGLTREEIRELRQYGREEASDSPFKREEDIKGIRNEDIKPKPKPGINLKKGAEQSVRRSSLIETPFSVEANEEGVQKITGNLPGGFGVSFGNDGFGASGFGFGVEAGEDKSSVELPGGIKITFINKGCFVITVQHIFNQYAFSNIERKPGCDDDDDDDNKPKPPHCIGSDGKSGTGEPKNLLPECTNDGKSHLYHILISFYEEQEIIYPSYPDRNLFRSREYRNKFLNESLFESKLIQNQTGTSEQVSTDIYPLIYTETITASYSGLLEYLSNRIINGQFGRVVDKVPDSKSSESTRLGWLDGWILTNITTKQKSWAYAWVISPGSGCNPTGDEGCESVSGTGNNNRSSSPKFPKPSGGLKSRNKSTEDDEMGCCSRMEKKLGLDGFPGELPASLLAKDDSKDPVKIENMTQLLLWLIDSLDERLGKFPIEMKIEDTDPLKKGKQSKTIDIPNISEMLAEQYGLLFQSSVNSQIQLNIQTNLLIENGLLKQALTRCENILDELVEYLGWEIQTSTRDIDIPFTPEKSNYDEFLQPSKLKVKRIDRKINEAEKPSLDTALDRLLEAATIIKQTNWRKINPSIDIASQIANYARLGLDVYNTVKGDKKDDEDWDAFKKQVTNESFYGSETKPIINDVGTSSSNGGSSNTGRG